MTKITTILFLILTLFWVFPMSAFAHVLKTDGVIGAIMHISPEDEPMANQESSFYFEFKDTTRKFSPQKCTCSLVIKKEGKIIYSQPLFQNITDPSMRNVSVPYTFPEQNVYEVVLTGKPLLGKSFQPFTLTYPIRVAKVDAAPNSQSNLKNNWFVQHAIHLVIIICIIAFIVKSGLQERKTKHPEKEEF